MTDKSKIAARIRALRQKTVENGCTEEEAATAAVMVADLLAKYNLSVEECDLRENEFSRSEQVFDDPVGERLWKVADGIAYMIGVKYWSSRPGEKPSVSFFGFDHEVEIAGYMLDICRAAMLHYSDQLAHELRLMRPSLRRRKTHAFLDGMADRLRRRIRDLKPKQPTGKGLVVLRDSLIEAAMEDEGLNIKQGSARSSRDYEPDYGRGVAAADNVALNQGVGGPDADTLRLR
ncbi:DUF2786 domain-containing protein [Alterisphingorhabdus coralli]|uniref:DUF2786 domain-containing protein n=1 Tax=Alterisphingorhabdus coralli TaxID=3071408 RepID=A0AA97F8Z6_9SPHN|nr:DUF2786 domain-containing protein [Parasphingorhabdus sp. SCSIO 66989]WOE76346.1 DUF2786 domain-containing protein [Parasphingorhabdus sp. SCSIO 66989]